MSRSKARDQFIRRKRWERMLPEVMRLQDYLVPTYVGRDVLRRYCYGGNIPCTKAMDKLEAALALTV